MTLPLFDSGPAIVGLRWVWLILPLRWGGVVLATLLALFGTYECFLCLIAAVRRLGHRDDHP